MRKRAVIVRGKLKYNPMDSHFWCYNGVQDRWVRMPRKWCQKNAPSDYIRLMEAISHEKAQYKENNLQAYNQAKALYLEIIKMPAKCKKNIYEAIVELLMYKGHLIGKHIFEVWEDILKEVHR